MEMTGGFVSREARDGSPLEWSFGQADVVLRTQVGAKGFEDEAAVGNDIFAIIQSGFFVVNTPFSVEVL